MAQRKIILRRKKSQEDANVHLWFQDSKMDFIVSLGGGKGDVSSRISTPKGSREYAHPFASTHWTKYSTDDFGDMQRYKDGIVRLMKRDFGYDVEVK
jgi:hypothetical protein